MEYNKNLPGLQEPRVGRRSFLKVIAGAVLAYPSISFGVPQLQEIIRPYGRAVYTKNPKQIYIIAQRHRDENLRSGRYTARIQTEIYRIAERLMNDKGISLLLKENLRADLKYDKKKLTENLIQQVGIGTYNNIISQLKNATDRTLEEILGNDDLAMRALEGIDAANLLQLNYPNKIDIQGAEDKDLFKLSIRNLYLIDSNLNLIDRIWEFRTAKILQNIPKVVDYGLNDNPDMNKSAIVILGVEHMNEIYRFLDVGNIDIKPPQIDESEIKKQLNLKGRNKKETQELMQGFRILMEGMNEPLRLFKEGYGVTVIIPETLIKIAPKYLPKHSS